MLAILLGLILFLFALHCVIRYRRVGRLLSLIPGPHEYPIIGNMHHFQGDDGVYLLLQKLWRMDNEYYPIYKVWTLHFRSVVLLDPEDIQVLLKSNEHIEKGVFYKYLRPRLFSGLLTSDGTKWHIRRKMITPAFHFNILKHYFINLNEESQNLVESLKKEEDGGPVVKDLRTFIKTALGTPLTGKSEQESKYRHAVHVYGRTAAYRLTRAWCYYDIIFRLTPLGRLQKEALKTLHNISRNIIAERKRFHKQTNGKYLLINENIKKDDVSYKDPEKDDEYLQSEERLSMLDLLIAASWNDNQIDEEGIREEVDTFMFEVGSRKYINLEDKGQKLAMLELKLFVAFILYNFELVPVDELDDVTFSADLSLTSSKPLRVKFIPIT